MVYGVVSRFTLASVGVSAAAVGVTAAVGWTAAAVAVAAAVGCAAAVVGVAATGTLVGVAHDTAETKRITISAQEMSLFIANLLRSSNGKRLLFHGPTIIPFIW